MSEPLSLEFKYDVNHNSATIKTDVCREKMLDVVSAYLQAQIGAGVDSSPSVNRDVYTIRLFLNLEDDSFRVADDCGNKGLRDGILMAVCGLLKDSPEKTAWV